MGARTRLIAASLMFGASAVSLCLGLRVPIFPFDVRPKAGLPSEFSYNDISQLGTAGPLLFRVGHASLKYSSIMSEDDTPTVTLHYEVYLNAECNGPAFCPDDDIKHQVLDVLDGPTTFSLSSAGFKVAPETPKTFDKGAHLPLEVEWTIDPKGAGDRALLLNISKYQNSDRFVFEPSTVDAALNGSDVKQNLSGYYELPISVTNVWGVSPLVASVSGVTFAFLGFLVTYPLVTAWFQSKTKIVPPNSPT